MFVQINLINVPLSKYYKRNYNEDGFYFLWAGFSPMVFLEVSNTHKNANLIQVTH